MISKNFAYFILIHLIILNSKLFVLKEEVEFLKKVVTIVKEMKS
jgi:hypothetical protein